MSLMLKNRVRRRTECAKEQGDRMCCVTNFMRCESALGV